MQTEFKPPFEAHSNTGIRLSSAQEPFSALDINLVLIAQQYNPHFECLDHRQADQRMISITLERNCLKSSPSSAKLYSKTLIHTCPA